jgi:hypothetical protein
MPKLYPRLTALFLWLAQRFEKLKTHKYGRASVFVFIIAIGLVVAFPAHAEQGFVDNALLFFANIAMSVAVLLSKLVIAIIEILLPIMLYNEFSTSPVVSMGWAIVRDTVNMFFVIVLIVIAFGTIFGQSRFQWQQQIPRLMIFALVINFSKTLCGLMIDVGQVVMLTFANALREVAAGNFLQMLGLTDIYSLSASNSIFIESAQSADAEGVKAFDWFASSVASVFMMLAVFVTMLMLLVILVYRVVMLWILIVISPLAWFVGGTQGLISSNAYGQWWERFKCLVVIGPILTFFLWLTLVVAGAGNIGSAENGFIAGGDSGLGDSAGGFLTNIFKLDRLISFVIGIAMLFAGFEAAQSACSSMPGIGNALRKGSPNRVANLGKTAAIGVAGFGAGIAAKGGGWGARKAGAGARYVGSGITGKAGQLAENTSYVRALTSKGRSQILRNVANNRGDSMFGRAASRAANRQADKLAGKRSQEIADAGAKYKDDSKQTKLDQLKRFGTNKPKTVGGQREAQALMMEAMKDKSMMKDLRASGQFKNLWGQYGSGLKKDLQHDDAATEEIRNFEKANADITGSADKINSQDDVNNLSPEALASSAVRDQLAKIQTSHKENGVSLNAAEAMAMGKFGKKEADIFNAASGGQGTLMEKMRDSELKQVGAQDLVNNGSADAIARGVGLAMEGGDSTKADQVISRLLSKIENMSTSGDDRFKANVALDNIKAELGKSHASSKFGDAGRSETKGLLDNFDSRRDVAERQFTWESKSDNAHGAIPNLAESLDFSKFTSGFENASFDRTLDGRSQLWNQADNHNQTTLPTAQTNVTNSLNQKAQDLERDLAENLESGSVGDRRQIRDDISNVNQTINVVQNFNSTPNDATSQAALLANGDVPQELKKAVEALQGYKTSIEKMSTLIDKKTG